MFIEIQVLALHPPHPGLIQTTLERREKKRYSRSQSTDACPRSNFHPASPERLVSA